MSVNDLFKKEVKVVNIGLESFKDALQDTGTEAVHIEWKPPLISDEILFKKIEKNREKIDEANKEAVKRILNGKPFLIGLEKAIDVIPGMKKNLILHAGPPISWDRMCGPMRGAIVGAIKYEGLARSDEEAEKLAASGEIEYAPCHEHSTVGPMAGIVAPSMPVFVLRNQEYGNKAYCTMNEGLGRVLRYGAFGPDVIERLKWMEEVLYPNLKKAIANIGEIDLKNIIAQALHMGE